MRWDFYPIATVMQWIRWCSSDIPDLHVQSSILGWVTRCHGCLNLNVKAPWSFKTSGTIYPVTQHNNPECFSHTPSTCINSKKLMYKIWLANKYLVDTVAIKTFCTNQTVCFCSHLLFFQFIVLQWWCYVTFNKNDQCKNGSTGIWKQAVMNLMFMKPCIARSVFYINNEMQLIQFSLLLSALYMIRAVFPPIIRSL